MCTAEGSRILKMPEGSVDNLCFKKALNTKKLYSSLSLASV